MIYRCTGSLQSELVLSHLTSDTEMQTNSTGKENKFIKKGEK